MRKYRKIRKTDKLPILPKGIIAKFLLQESKITKLIFAENKSGEKFTFRWDEVSEFPNDVYSNREN